MGSTSAADNGNVHATGIELLAMPGELPIEQSRREEAVALHPADRGWHAWLFVVCASGLEVCVWGFPLCYGIFQDWYLTHEFSGASEAAINSVGTLTLAIQYAEGIFVIFFARRYARYLRQMMLACLAICVLSMFLSSFSTKVWHLILLQGIVYGASGGLLYSPYIIWLPEWFSERRSVAGSLIFAGMGLGGAIFPPIMNYLLERTGFRWTLRVWSAMLLLFGGVSIVGIKPRLPVAPASYSGPLPPVDLTFLKSPLFLSMACAIFIQGLAYFCVSLYIPSYATTLGLSRIEGTIALSAFNLASVIGQVLFGFYCDHRPFTRVIIFSGFICSVLAWVLWGFAHDLATVFIFTVSFASVGGGFVSTWVPASGEVSISQPSTVIMCFAVVKGFSAIAGPLVAAALHPKKPASGYLKAGRGGWGGYGFTSITMFVGSAMAATAVMGLVSTLVRQRFVISRQPQA